MLTGRPANTTTVPCNLFCLTCLLFSFIFSINFVLICSLLHVFLEVFVELCASLGFNFSGIRHAGLLYWVVDNYLLLFLENSKKLNLMEMLGLKLTTFNRVWSHLMGDTVVFRSVMREANTRTFCVITFDYWDCYHWPHLLYFESVA